MCGICGVIGGDPVRERERVRAMTAALAHRGPDDAGISDAGGAMLGNTRLAIQDPSAAGHQPLSTEDGAYWITYNGEIYDFHELRRELEAGGSQFRTGTDTEVLLALFRRDGPACLAHLRGMFAFAIWDRRRKRLFAARDRFGQKPFYWAAIGTRFLFASEIKALLAHGELTVEPEPAAIDDYLSLRFIAPPLTMVRGIQKLPAGHWLEWGEDGVRIERYWAPVFGGGADGHRTDAEWIDELAVRIDEAVAMHMVSDVPVGAFLSGGLDSSVVVAKMAKRSSVPISTFCVGSDVPAYDERGHARTMAAHSGTAHHEVAVSSDLLHRIPRLVRCMDEPSDPIAACIDEVARLASRHVKVVLGGDGGDEMFAGFDRYAAFPWVARYAALPAWLCTGVFGRAAGALPESFAYKSLSQKARWLASVSVERGGRLYARMTSHFRFGPEDKQWLYGPWLRAALGSRDTLAAVAEPFERTPAHDDLDRMIGADLLTRLPEHTLMLADRLGMAHGLEVRAPLLDVPLAELCLAMPARLRIRGTVTKYALRRAAQPWLPTSLLRRAKQGFMFPVAYWLAGERLRDVAATLRAGPLLREGWVEAPAIDRLIEEHAARRADHHVRIWMLMSLDAWHRIYLGGEQAGEA